MACTFNWCEDNGTLVSSHGTTRSGFGVDTHYATDVNWKSLDDCTANGGTAYGSAPIVAGQNSYIKYQYGYFSGSFNQVLNCKWSARTAPAGSLAAGISLYGKVTSTYSPQTTTMTGQTDYTSAPVAIGSGTAVSFSTTGPEAGSPTATLSAAGYSQYLASQLITTTAAAAGDMSSITASLQYDENVSVGLCGVGCFVGPEMKTARALINTAIMV